MAGTAAKVALLTIMVASVCLDVCMACGVCSGGGGGGGSGGGGGGSGGGGGGGGTPVITPKTPKSPKSPKGGSMNTPKSPKGGPMNGPPLPGGPMNGPPQFRPPTLPPRTCPVDIVKLGVCSPLLGGIVGGLLPPSNDCCALLKLLGVDIELCLCLALDANILGLISIHAKVDAVVTIVTSCGFKVPPNFACPRF